jgi:hypothetical protein
MPGINTQKVVVGGLVAAVVFAVIDGVIFGVLLKTELEAGTVRLGLDPAVAMSTAGIAMWVVMELVFGQLVVWTYAAMRPRFGPGVKTAMYAGLVPWLSTFLIFASQTQTGIHTTSLFWKAAVLSLISVMVGTIAGAAVYKEAA